MRNPMKYGKAKGIVLLQKYLPKISPFEDVKIISTIDEWNAVKDEYGDFISHRVDMPIGTNKKNAVKGTNGFKDSIQGLIEEVNKQGSEGVVLLMRTKEPPFYRYENDGGFNIFFTLDENIVIELVGKGFDGHELTQGWAMHERYIIPWDEALFIRDRIDMLKNDSVVKARVTPKCYTKQRKERIEFLRNDCHYDIADIEKNVPEQYNLIDNEIIKRIMDDVIFELITKQNLLRQDGLKKFVVQGNLLHGKVQPWEIFRTERWANIANELDR